jgi:hypothetical protein
MRLPALRFPRFSCEGKKDDGVPGAAKQHGRRSIGFAVVMAGIRSSGELGLLLSPLWGRVGEGAVVRKLDLV